MYRENNNGQRTVLCWTLAKLKPRGLAGWGHLLSKRVECAARSPGPLPLSRHDSDSFPDKSKVNISREVGGGGGGGG